MINIDSTIKIDDSTTWLDAEAAADFLGVKRSTLYAYVSRGRLRSRQSGTRHRLYSFEDLERLRASRDARAGHGAVAAGALRWGEPVLDSAITEITAEGPVYRGYLATELAGAVSFERVAGLLIGGRLSNRDVGWAAQSTSNESTSNNETRMPLDRMLAAIPRLAANDDARYDRNAHLRIAQTIFGGLCRSQGGSSGEAANAAECCAEALEVAPTKRNVFAINAALILCADHELNASTFASRVAAGAGADPYSCVAAALATFSGRRHGGMSAQIGELVASIPAPERAVARVREILSRGDDVAGFGHPLYADGDPRAIPLLALAQTLGPGRKTVRTLGAVVDAMDLVGAGRPNVDLALFALGSALGMPVYGAMVLFALGRTAGWLAHAAEQAATATMLRPRARFVGETKRRTVS